MSIQKQIIELWKQLECPIFDGILYSNGSMTNVLGTPTDFPPDCSDNNITFLTILDEFELSDFKCKIVCGESAAHGSDGFIAMTELYTESLLWIFYSTESNPFYQISHAGEDITCKTTSGLIAKFKCSINAVTININAEQGA